MDLLFVQALRARCKACNVAVVREPERVAVQQCLKHCVASMALQAYTRPFQVMFIDKMLRNIGHLELPEAVPMLLLACL